VYVGLPCIGKGYLLLELSSHLVFFKMMVIPISSILLWIMAAPSSCLPHSPLLHFLKPHSRQRQRRFPICETHRNCSRVCVRSVHKFPSQRPFLHHDICIAGPIVCIHLLVSFLEREQTHLALHI
jgi:hypothetical protein